VASAYPPEFDCGTPRRPPGLENAEDKVNKRFCKFVENQINGVFENLNEQIHDGLLSDHTTFCAVWKFNAHTMCAWSKQNGF
jgi:hypothetical protein